MKFKGKRRPGILLALLLGLAGAAAPAAWAQFHSQSSDGQSQINQGAVNQAMQQAAAMQHSGGMGSDYAAGLSGGDMILPEEMRQALAEYGVSIAQLRGRPVDVWGRMIHHGDGSYTESKEDLDRDSLEQITKSRNGVTLQRRLISLDQMKRPSEVLIYNGRDEFRYRGVLLYDRFNRFSEEQIYDAKGNLIRRKVQEYTPDGHKRPLRSWDYVANVPEDLKLIVLRESEEAQTRSAQASATPERRPLFGSKRTQGQASTPTQAPPAHQAAPVYQPPVAPMQAEASSALQAVPAQVAADGEAAPEARRGLNLGRMFGGRGR